MCGLYVAFAFFYPKLWDSITYFDSLLPKHEEGFKAKLKIIGWKV